MNSKTSLTVFQIRRCNLHCDKIFIQGQSGSGRKIILIYIISRYSKENTWTLSNHLVFEPYYHILLPHVIKLLLLNLSLGVRPSSFIGVQKQLTALHYSNDYWSPVGDVTRVPRLWRQEDDVFFRTEQHKRLYFPWSSNDFVFVNNVNQNHGVCNWFFSSPRMTLYYWVISHLNPRAGKK